jgi:hypothetical protein
VKSIAELATTDPNIGARGMRLEKVQPFLGPVKMFGSPLKLSQTPGDVRGYAPFLGENNEEILSEILDYKPEDISNLYRGNVLYHAPEVERLPRCSKSIKKRKAIKSCTVNHMRHSCLRNHYCAVFSDLRKVPLDRRSPGEAYADGESDAGITNTQYCRQFKTMKASWHSRC